MSHPLTAYAEFPSARSTWLPSMIFLLLLITIGGAGYAHFLNQKNVTERNALEQIAAISDIKASEIARWLKQRRREAAALYYGRLHDDLKGYLEDPSAPANHERAFTYLVSLARNYDYQSAALINQDGAVLLSFPTVEADQSGMFLQPETMDLIAKALETGQIVFSDIYNDASPRIDFIIPLLVRRGESADPVNVLLLRIDPKTSLFPLINIWPTSGPTAEILLVHQLGDSVTALSEAAPYQDSATASSLLPGELAELAAAALSNQDLQGVDHNGAEALASVRAIPDSAWGILVKVNREEIAAPIRRNALRTALIVGLLMLTASLLTLVLWRRHSELMLREARDQLASRVRERTAELEVLNASLRESEERYRQTMDATLVGIYVIQDLTFSYVNPTMAQLLGYTVEAMENKLSVLDTVAPEYRDLIRKRLLQRAQGAPGAPIELKCVRKDGSAFDALVQSKAALYRGQPAVVGALIDITERKQTEVLLKAKQVAEAASRAKSEFLASMSHEIRTPMNAIIGMADLTLETDLTEEQREYITLLKSSADALMNIIDDILDFSRIESGQLRIEAIEFSLRRLLAETLKTLAVRARQKGLELSYEVDPALEDGLIGDPGRLRQILVNLTGNAIKFTETGKISVRVGADAVTEETVVLHFSVRDTGIGISPEQQQHIFEPFVQADSTITRRYGGTGLGLTICARLAAMMDGKIWLQSASEQGSEFHFTARFRRQPHSIAPQPAPPAPSPREPDVRRGDPPLRVLLAEDNVVNQKLIVRILEKQGHRVIIASHGREAVELAAQQRFDVILMDVQMPEMSGLEATRLIREQERSSGRHTCIIAMTAHAMRSDRERCLAAGMDDYISKPIKPRHLLEMLNKAYHTSP